MKEREGMKEMKAMIEKNCWNEFLPQPLSPQWKEWKGSPPKEQRSHQTLMNEENEEFVAQRGVFVFFLFN